MTDGIDTVDSSKSAIGSRFTVSLETNLEVNGVVLDPAGTRVYGRLTQSKEAGRLAGRAELLLELTETFSTELPVQS